MTTSSNPSDHREEQSPNSLDSQSSQANSARALDALLAQYRSLSDSERMKGNLFEQLIKQYLLNDAQMKLEFQEVYLWKDWPGNNKLPDTGIDLVATTRDVDGNPGQAVAIQCKFYEPNHTIQKSDIDSFLSESGKHPYTSRIVVETTGKPWSTNAQNAIEHQQIPVRLVGLTDLRNSDIDWSTYRLEEPASGPDHLERKVLRDHQAAAISDVFRGFENHDRGTLVMACGTGKTFTSLKIAEKLAEQNDGSARILFMVPSLALMSQTLGEWATECEIPFHAWSVCSDTKVNRRRAKQQDIVDISVTDLKTPPTTSPQKLATSLANNSDEPGLQVVFATYQSIEVISEAQKLGAATWRDFDLIICDEAHRTTGVTLVGESESSFVKVHDNNFIRANRRLYMTATPKLFKPEVKHAAKEIDAVLASMDDEQLYGPIFHKLGFGEAVSLHLLSDYKVVVLAVPEDQVSGMYQAQTAEEGELNLPELAKLSGVWNALAKRKSGTFDVSYGNDLTPMRRAVAFTKDIKTSKWVADEFPHLVSDHLQDLNNQNATDNLSVQAKHVDGTMNAIVRGESIDWLKDEVDTVTIDEQAVPTCRILTNARCLTEGVDVPSLDAVIFLNPRKSQVDVIQAVGRVMRKAPDKEFGYVILPIAIPAGTTPEQALSDNVRYKIIWQVLQALRAHDERLDAQINSIEYNTSDPTSVLVDVVDFSGKNDGSDHFSGEDDGKNTQEPGATTQNGIQGQFYFSPTEWKDAVYSRIVKKVGDRLYWDDWSKDIATIAERYIHLINLLIKDPDHKDIFTSYVGSLRAILNPGIDESQAIEMLAQHLITKPLFDAMFDDSSFTEQNPVSKAMENVVQVLGDNEMFLKEREPLEAFYSTMVNRIEQIDNMAGKQEIMRTLYDNFFSKAFPAMANRLGIVFTPVSVVDYILYSADDALRKHFGTTLGAPDVSLLEPFLGTGTFISRAISSGIIPTDQLEQKYNQGIFGNEIVLLSYYIASVNIEATYRQTRIEQGYDDEYTEFKGIALTDTFQLNESDDDITGLNFDFADNIDRLRRQKQAKIKVIVMNPPYSAGQESANDDNQNLKYPRLDSRIESTYVDKSSATTKIKLYDSYYRALRWATDRLGDEGVIAFVSNSSFLDDRTADGVRRTFQEEFSDIYIYNLRGGVRGKVGDSAKKEGGNVFPIQTGVAITVLVKKSGTAQQADIHYAEVDDYLTGQEKVDAIIQNKSLASTTFSDIKPSEYGDWLSKRDETFGTFQALGDKSTKGKSTTSAMFTQYSLGLNTNRDAWCWSFGANRAAENVHRMVSNYNAQLDTGVKSFDPALVAWSSSLDSLYTRGIRLEFDADRIRRGIYRPFVKQNVYFDNSLVHRMGQMNRIFPTASHPNISFGPNGERRRSFSVLMTDITPDLEMVSKAQWFPLYTWAPISGDDYSSPSLFDIDGSPTNGEPQRIVIDFQRSIDEQVPAIFGGYRRQDNITDGTLEAYRDHYEESHVSNDSSGRSIGKEDIFFYVYALLHSPEYRDRYEADLKKMLAHIPMVPGFWEYSRIGRRLADLHVNYEFVEPYPLNESWALGTPVDARDRYHITKLQWSKNGRKKDKSCLIYNEYLTLSGIPESVDTYRIGDRSPLDWIVDRYRVTRNNKSGILNDPNDYLMENDDPSYVVSLIKSLVNVAVKTIDLIEELPVLDIDDSI